MPFRNDALNETADCFVIDGKLEGGDTVRINHMTCSDTRRRGYISRKYNDGGAIVDLFYCHNCGDSDYRLANSGVYARLTALPPTSKFEPLHLPEDTQSVVDSRTPRHIFDWANSYGVVHYAH